MWHAWIDRGAILEIDALARQLSRVARTMSGSARFSPRRVPKSWEVASLMSRHDRSWDLSFGANLLEDNQI